MISVGAIGLKGEEGDAGLVIEGEVGPKGEVGVPGRFGFDGWPGLKGERGEDGPFGEVIGMTEKKSKSQVCDFRYPFILHFFCSLFSKVWRTW